MGWPRLVVSALVVGVIGAPAITDSDSFPVSTYPMYSRPRADVVSIATVVQVDPNGSVERLSLTLIGNSDDPLIVEALVRDSIRDGGRGAPLLCADVARRVADRDERAPTEGVEIEVVSERHDVVALVRGDESLVAREVHARCPLDP
ncbi:MAG: hypothetical protein OEU32_09360 [Acidimicrobiia bacterium]|nr:hypothetical protein [Acidimicrobiia bacterium]